MPRERMVVKATDKAFSSSGDLLSLEDLKREFSELADAIKIDKHDLDEDLVRQPSLYHRVGQNYAFAAALRDNKKNERDTRRNSAMEELRESTTEKMSETRLASLVALDSEYIYLDEEYQKLCVLAARWASLREDYHSRGFALRELAALWIAGYHQSSSVTSAALDRRGDHAKEMIRNRTPMRAHESVGRDRYTRDRDAD